MALPISVRDRLTRPGSETIPDHDVKHLIVNADGYGFTTGVNRGIEETVERGIVTSISANANCTAIEDLPSFVERFPHVSVGVHLNPVVGPSICRPGDRVPRWPIASYRRHAWATRVCKSTGRSLT